MACSADAVTGSDYYLIFIPLRATMGHAPLLDRPLFLGGHRGTGGTVVDTAANLDLTRSFESRIVKRGMGSPRNRPQGLMTPVAPWRRKAGAFKNPAGKASTARLLSRREVD